MLRLGFFLEGIETPAWGGDGGALAWCVVFGVSRRRGDDGIRAGMR